MHPPQHLFNVFIVGFHPMLDGIYFMIIPSVKLLVGFFEVADEVNCHRFMKGNHLAVV